MRLVDDGTDDDAEDETQEDLLGEREPAARCRGGLGLSHSNSVLPDGAGYRAILSELDGWAAADEGLHPQGSRGQFSRIQARRLAELPLPLRQVDWKPPLVGAATTGTNGARTIPPTMGRGAWQWAR